jgi:3-hydroxybutyryl-CoA dehydrogenase
MSKIGIVAVVGAGTMGSGITQVFAEKGFDVLVYESNFAARHGAQAKIEQFISKRVEKGQVSLEDGQKSIRRIRWCEDLEGLRDADFVVEAIIEDFALKSEVFAQLDQLMEPGVILASNTSSISVTKLASATKRADKCIGMHFMNPVPLMPLVEIIRGHVTSDETCNATEELARALDKKPVEVNDYPGFVSNRVLMPMINEAIYALWEGVGSKESIDQVMKLGMNHPMGPLELADFIGLDVCLAILNVLHEGFLDPKYRPCPLLRKMVDAGFLGRKSGRGFYQY